MMKHVSKNSVDETTGKTQTIFCCSQGYSWVPIEIIDTPAHTQLSLKVFLIDFEPLCCHALERFVLILTLICEKVAFLGAFGNIFVVSALCIGFLYTK